MRQQTHALLELGDDIGNAQRSEFSYDLPVRDLSQITPCSNIKVLADEFDASIAEQTLNTTGMNAARRLVDAVRIDSAVKCFCIGRI